MKSKGAAKTRHYAGPIKVMNVRKSVRLLARAPKYDLRLLKHNQIPAFHVGSDWRFNIETIDNWRLAQGKLGGCSSVGSVDTAFRVGRTLVWRAGRAGSARRRVVGQGLDTRRAFKTVSAARRF